MLLSTTDVLKYVQCFRHLDFSTLFFFPDFFQSIIRAQNIVRVIGGKIVEKWFEGQQKLLRVSLGKITVTSCMKSVKEFQGKSTWVSAMFGLARVRTIGMPRRFDFAWSTLNFTDHTRFLFYICLFSNIELASSFTICP